MSFTKGRVIASDMRYFSIIYAKPQNLPPGIVFGGLVSVPSKTGSTIGLVVNIEIEGDRLAEHLARRDIPEAVALDMQENRLPGAIVTAVTVGYYNGETAVYTLPPQPPMMFDKVTPMDDETLKGFTGEPFYLGLLMGTDRLPLPLPFLFAGHCRILADVAGETAVLQAVQYVHERFKNSHDSLKQFEEALAGAGFREPKETEE